MYAKSDFMKTICMTLLLELARTDGVKFFILSCDTCTHVLAHGCLKENNYRKRWYRRRRLYAFVKLGYNRISFGQKFLLFTEPMTWNQASEECIKNDGYLAIVGNLSSLSDLLGNDTELRFQYIWNGLQKMDNVTLDKVTDTWSNWDPASTACKDKKCVVVSTKYPYYWYPEFCNQLQPFACEFMKAGNGETETSTYERMSASADHQTAMTTKYDLALASPRIEATKTMASTSEERHGFPSQGATLSISARKIHQKGAKSTTETPREVPEAFRFGRVYLAYEEEKSWLQAEGSCQKMGGHLAKVYDISTIPDMKISINITSFWIGLSWIGKKWRWIDGKEPTWLNWEDPPPSKPAHRCSVASTDGDSLWYPANCSENWPYVCEVRNGSCGYTLISSASIVAHNNMDASQKTAEECMEICDSNNISFVCLSFEYNKQYSYCQFSEHNMWTKKLEFIHGQNKWDYYHRTCNKGSFTHPVGKTTVMETTGISTITTLEPSTTFNDFTSTTTSAEGISKIVVCTEVVYGNNSRPVTNVFTTSYVASSTVDRDHVSEGIRQLQEMAAKSKAKRKLAKKISVPDHRVSATTIGATAVIILISVFSGIVLLDVATIGQQCRILKKNVRHRRRRKGCPDSVRIKTISPRDSTLRNHMLTSMSSALSNGGVHRSAAGEDNEEILSAEVLEIFKEAGARPDEVALDLMGSDTSLWNGVDNVRAPAAARSWSGGSHVPAIFQKDVRLQRHGEGTGTISEFTHL